MSRTVTLSAPEVQAHVLFEEPRQIRLGDTDADLLAVYASIRDGHPASPLARVRDHGQEARMVRVQWGDLPEDLRHEIGDRFTDLMMGAACALRTGVAA